MKTIPRHPHPLLLLVALAVACSRTPPEPNDSTDKPPGHETGQSTSSLQVSFSIADLMSSVGVTQLAVWIDNGTRPVPPAVLEEMAARLSLRTLPDLRQVPIKIEIQQSVSEPEPPSGHGEKGTPQSGTDLPKDLGRAGLNVLLERTLADGWYVLALERLPAGARVEVFLGVSDSRFGAYAVRFNPGTSPVVRLVEACTGDDGGAITMVRFSEGVDSAAMASKLGVNDTGSGIACPAVPPSNSSVPASSGQFRCSPEAWKLKNLDVNIGAGLGGPDGQPLGVFNAQAASADSLRVPGPQKLSIDFASIPEYQPGCRYWAPR